MYDPMNLAMPQIMDSFKLLQAGQLRGRRWPLAATLSMVVMLGVGLPALLWVLYHHGASSLSRWPFYSYPQWAFAELDFSPLNAGGAGQLAAAGHAPRRRLHAGAGLAAQQFRLVAAEPGRLSDRERIRDQPLSLDERAAGMGTDNAGAALWRTEAIPGDAPAFLGLVLGDYLTDAGLAILSTALGTNLPPA